QRIVIFGGLLFAFVAMGCAQTPASLFSSTSEHSLIKQYCSGCHNDKLKSGGMTLTKLDLEHPGQSAELAEKVIRKLRVGLMPPPGMPRPDTATIQAFATALENGID